MAQIRMDVSEYEALKENKRLLENSLAKEHELTKQIEILNKEKMMAYEEAAMKVVITKRTEHTEHIIRPYTILESNDLHHLLSSYGLILGYGEANEFMTKLAQRVIKKETVHSPAKVETTLHGLDEVTAMLKKDIEAEISKSTQAKLKRLDIMDKKFYELMISYNDLEADNSLLKNSNTILRDSIVRLKSEIKANLKVVNFYKDLVANSNSFWERLKLLRKLPKYTPSDESK